MSMDVKSAEEVRAVACQGNMNPDVIRNDTLLIFVVSDVAGYCRLI